VLRLKNGAQADATARGPPESARAPFSPHGPSARGRGSGNEEKIRVVAYF